MDIFWIYVSLAILASALLLFLIIFIGVVELGTDADGKPRSSQGALTAFNLALFTGICALIGYDACQAISVYLSPSDWRDYLLQFFSDLFQSLWGIMYLFFSFKRSYNQIRIMLKEHFDWIRVAWLVSPVPLLIPAFLAVCKLIDRKMFDRTGKSEFFWYQCSQILCIVILASFDALFAACFTKYLTRTLVDKSCEYDRKFLIISRYGTAANALCLTMIPLWVASIVLYFIDIAKNAAYLFHYNMFAVTIAVLMNAVYFILFAMKIALYYQRKQESEQEAERITKIHRKSSGTIFENPTKTKNAV
ncbi:hypothetical protein HDU83_000834 [Entophlyctis luteolus]|nr:hypothetical protein HDU83_000834 [Entophlyctis luteolus]KAJ3389089.1 hypothetical protein HDU84_009185 [Entophlyctis sp. JEL0112]